MLQTAFLAMAGQTSRAQPADMPRRPRLHLPSIPQHVVQRGNNRLPCFLAEDDYRHYLDCLADGALRFGCCVHAYVLMTNHVHLLATGGTKDSIPDMMQSLGVRYVRYVNQRHGRTGTLWEGRYHSSLVDSDTHLLRCMQYIETNPVRASMVSSPARWRWSSFRCNALGVPDERISPHPVFQQLGRDPDARASAYRRMFAQALSADDLESIRDAARGGLPVGSDAFRRSVADRLGPAAIPGIPGRPTHGAERKKSVSDPEKSVSDPGFLPVPEDAREKRV